ncbi:hypothetical protein [Acidithiobacillus sp. AMEEHan]|uniref:hypothetical protein n=1 Tax=Acidithiobacillus sp. AMEEHan TaxID=2994951 RepID=UPI0027E56A24|nr:hypothetical protein [Acidithiobacillus sp. AMEEHan]
MIRRSLLASTLLLLPALAWADANTTAALQHAYAQFQNLQKSAHLTPQQSAGLQRDLQQMTADQVNPPLFAVDKAIFEARLHGLREAQASTNSGQEKEVLTRQLATLNQKIPVPPGGICAASPAIGEPDHAGCPQRPPETGDSAAETTVTARGTESGDDATQHGSEYE